MWHECMVYDTQSKGDGSAQEINHDEQLHSAVSTVPCGGVVADTSQEIEQGKH